MRVVDYKELRVYRLAYDSAMEVFRLSRSWPSEEKFSLVDQVRRSSRSVCANIAEAWRKRRYEAAFIAKLSDAEGEACETQVWLEMANRFGYLSKPQVEKIDDQYDPIIAQVVRMIDESK